jgi:hypothetical protein
MEERVWTSVEASVASLTEMSLNLVTQEIVQISLKYFLLWDLELQCADKGKSTFSF